MNSKNETMQMATAQQTVLENIFTRRSVRSFKETKISEEDLNTIVKAGMYAPSGMNRQTWQFTVLLNQEKMQHLANLVGKALARENYNFYKPVALIIPTNDRENTLGQDDNACALENMFLAAHALGIGSVWINQLRTICDEPEIREMLREFGIPDSHVVYGAVALGYANADLPEKERHATIRFVR